MSYGLSPSIDIREKDFLSPGRQTANRFGAMCGDFMWGPVGERIPIVDEKVLIENFNAPVDSNYADWFSASNYLAYNDKLYVVRAIKESGSLNAGVSLFSEALQKLSLTSVIGTFVVGETVTGGTSTAKGTVVSIVNDDIYIKITSVAPFETTEIVTADGGATGTISTITDNQQSVPFTSLKKNFDHDITVNDEAFIKFKFLAKYPGDYGNNISVAVADSTSFATATITGTTTFKSVFDYSPSSTELAVVVLLNGSIAETFIVSLTPGAKNYRNEAYYIETYLARNSKYVYCYDNNSITFSLGTVSAVSLTGGAHVAPEASDLISAYDLFANKEELDVDVIFEANAANITSGNTVIQHIIDNILDVRKDCRGVFSATYNDVVNVAIATAVTNLEDYVSTTINRNSSYAAFYGNYKYQFDRYNDVYRWVPINGDIAGIYSIGQAWESPAGLNRGLIKNCIKLAINPNESYRDFMYPLGINPVYTLKNVGHVVMGQRTLATSSPSLFSRVDNRGLFILLEKNTADVARYYQFQKNTATERRRFVADIEPLFRQVQGLGGIEEYLIICDETNNTDTETANYTLVCDIFVRPNQSVEWIQLNFSAVQNVVNFEEIIASPYAS
jgi:hypothetical protein